MSGKTIRSIGVWTAVLWIAATPARALINPNYTVVDLVRDSGQVFVLSVSAPQSGRVEAEIVEALVGDVPAERKLSFDFSDAEELTEDDVAAAFGGASTAPAVMCVMKDEQDGAVLGALEIGTRWMGLVQGKTTSSWVLDRDPNDLETVWGGSVRQLVPAIRHTLSDRRPDFPVASTLTWGSDLSLSKLGAASGLGQGDDVVAAACPSDVNGDGRRSAALFHATSGPGLFFSRGFACFGVARSLEFSQADLPAAQALGTGQTAGVLCDLNGDLAPDLIAVDRQQAVWVVFGESERSRRFQAVVSLADPAGGPLSVTALMGERRLGIWVIRPGEPTIVNLPRAGPLKLQWKQMDGTPVSRDVIVTRPTPVAL